MNVLSVKGVRLGAGRPKTIVSLMDTQVPDLIASAQRAVAAGADLLEWRLDFAPELAGEVHDLSCALPHTPLIATFRSTGQGGQSELSADAYEQLLRQLIATNCIDIIDIELGLGDARVRALVQEARAHDVLSIVSHHDFDKTPTKAEMVELLTHMAALGASIPKLAVMAHDMQDCLRLMEATDATAAELEQPLITMAMGKAGALSRLAGESCRSAATFCALERPSAPGQVELSQAIACLDQLHAIMG
ncbi:MAG: type I 3-dehydroquinate dehydratase [Coriobacteriales bacterium]|nr:type I 3-dehydroquinate dehydratase [Coriobacteriales bacterium]